MSFDANENSTSDVGSPRAKDEQTNQEAHNKHDTSRIVEDACCACVDALPGKDTSATIFAAENDMNLFF